MENKCDSKKKKDTGESARKKRKEKASSKKSKITVKTNLMGDIDKFECRVNLVPIEIDSYVQRKRKRSDDSLSRTEIPNVENFEKNIQDIESRVKQEVKEKNEFLPKNKMRSTKRQDFISKAYTFHKFEDLMLHNSITEKCIHMILPILLRSIDTHHNVNPDILSSLIKCIPGDVSDWEADCIMNVARLHFIYHPPNEEYMKKYYQILSSYFFCFNEKTKLYELAESTFLGIIDYLPESLEEDISFPATRYLDDASLCGIKKTERMLKYLEILIELMEIDLRPRVMETESDRKGSFKSDPPLVMYAFWGSKYDNFGLIHNSCAKIFTMYVCYTQPYRILFGRLINLLAEITMLINSPPQKKNFHPMTQEYKFIFTNILSEILNGTEDKIALIEELPSVWLRLQISCSLLIGNDSVNLQNSLCIKQLHKIMKFLKEDLLARIKKSQLQSQSKIKKKNKGSKHSKDMLTECHQSSTLGKKYNLRSSILRSQELEGSVSMISELTEKNGSNTKYASGTSELQPSDCLTKNSCSCHCSFKTDLHLFTCYLSAYIKSYDLQRRRNTTCSKLKMQVGQLKKINDSLQEIFKFVLKSRTEITNSECFLKLSYLLESCSQMGML